MTSSEYTEWVEQSIPAYAADKVASGDWAPEDSLDRSRQVYNELLPQGLETPDNFLFSIIDSNYETIGMLWFAVIDKLDAKIAFVYDVSVKPERQREGHATRAFNDLESEVLKRGLSGIALHVFGHNLGARDLYKKLGYEPEHISLFKPLAQKPPPWPS